MSKKILERDTEGSWKIVHLCILPNEGKIGNSANCKKLFNNEVKRDLINPFRKSQGNIPIFFDWSKI